MQWQGLKIQVIILSLLAGVAIIFGIQWLYQKYSFQEPLYVVLSKNKAVESFQINKDGRTMLIGVTLNYNADIMQDYKEIKKDINRAAGGRQFILSLEDNRDDALKKVWYKSQYAIYQALAQGSYQEMAEVINREARSADAEAYIYIDQDNIYIRLKHQGKTLDEVISRNAGQVPSNARVSAGGGGSSVQRN